MTDAREPDETSEISRMRWRLGLPGFVIPLHVGWGPETVSAHLPVFDKRPNRHIVLETAVWRGCASLTICAT
jgi:hypothetical protein